MLTTDEAKKVVHPTAEELTTKLVKFSGSGQIDDFEDDYGTWKLREPIPCEGPVFLFIRVLDVQDAGLAHGHKWGAEVIAVSPFFATDAAICDALRSSWSDYMWEYWFKADDETKVAMLCDALMSYGVQAVLFSKTSTRAIGPFRACFNELAKMSMMFGFYADRALNTIGDTGWEFMKGSYGFQKKEPLRKPTGLQAEVLEWLNTHYPERVAFHNEES